jgi:formylglycine-generating enzyme required for sulfatase activity
MGTPDGDGDTKESPQHFVKVPQFFMGKYPVTQAQWLAVMGGKNPSYFQKDFGKSGDALQRPVEKVSWQDTQKFCKRLTELTGKPYQLPTEAQWEYACRAIVPEEKGEALTQKIWDEKYHQPFYFGETISTEIANYNGNSTYGRGSEGEYRKQTTSVDCFGIANRFGLCEMHGNVWEWCLDHWYRNYEYSSNYGNAWKAWKEGGDSRRIVRGGSWFDDPRSCRSACRLGNLPNARINYLGFRVVCSS